MSTEGDQMILGLKNCYGTGTRSYNRSAEKREIDRQRKAATKMYVHESVDVLLCHCLSFRYPHWVEQHRLLPSEHYWGPPRERHIDYFGDIR